MALNQQQAAANQHAAPAQDTSAILAALANMAKQTTAAPPPSAAPAPASMISGMGPQNGIPQSTPSVDSGLSAANGQAVNPLGALLAGMSNGVQTQNQSATQQQNPLASLLTQTQVPALPQAATLGSEAQQQFQLIQLMAAQGIPPEQWSTALQLLNLQSATASGQNFGGGLPNFAQPQPQPGWAGRSDAPSRDHDSQEYMRSPPYRRRSRSPGWERRRDASPPRRRDSPVYGDYRSDRNRDARRGDSYRQRSPAGGRRRRSPSPPRNDPPLPPPGKKSIGFDHAMGQGNIKVLSRTLFVGGVTTSEAHLRSLFSKHGIVQTCIVNIDKRHAFVKMVARKDAVVAREAMEQYKSGDMTLRVRVPYSPVGSVTDQQ